MGDQPKDGGPAFAHFVPEGHYNGSVHYEGMTLRDWFAGRADGLHEDATANYASRFNRDEQPPKDDLFAWAVWFAKADATLRYIRADAMIAARMALVGLKAEGV